MDTPLSGSQVVAHQLRDLGVTTIFGLVGVPVTEIAEEAINIGIRFIGCRNEQSASYAATAHGYLTGRPGVCLLVGGPGVLHGMAGIGNASANAFPLLVLAGSHETYLTTKGAFQEMDAVSVLTPHTKLAIRPAGPNLIASSIREAYRASWYGRPGPAFVDLPANFISAKISPSSSAGRASQNTLKLAAPPRAGGDEAAITRAAEALKSAKAPLIIIGKGAAYAKAEDHIRLLIETSQIPFLPSPMGKGVVEDSHALNASSARSAALKLADVVLVLGARLNWIFHYGEAPKWNPKAKIIQVDISADEIGSNGGDASLGLVGDVRIVVPMLRKCLADWKYDINSDYGKQLAVAKERNEAKAMEKAAKTSLPLQFEHAFGIIRDTLHSLSPPEKGETVYISEGSQTMDISRSMFPLEHPRLRLDAGTYATMGVGMAYAIAAHDAYNAPSAQEMPGLSRKKKIVAIEGDSAFGFSAMEVETMARQNMDVLIFIMNNGGIYHGDAKTREDFAEKQAQPVGPKALRSWALSHQVRYEKLAEACGGKGFFVHTAEELRRATKEGFEAKVPVIVNVVLDSSRIENSILFSWQNLQQSSKL